LSHTSSMGQPCLGPSCVCLLYSWDDRHTPPCSAIGWDGILLTFYMLSRNTNLFQFDLPLFLFLLRFHHSSHPDKALEVPLTSTTMSNIQSADNYLHQINANISFSGHLFPFV
jgi:hypothetical protein